MLKRVLFVLTLLLSGSLYAASLPVTGNPIPNATGHTTSVKLKNKTADNWEVANIKKKKSLKVRFQNWVLKKLISNPYKEEDFQKKGKTVLILGIIAAGSLLIPYLGILSLPLAIVALVMGYKLLRQDPNNKNARTGIIFAWVTIGLVALFLSVLGVILILTAM